MTRETKIGLLVGLVFIIVVGILLSENFHGASELPQAALDKAGNTARLAVNVPGATPMAAQSAPVSGDPVPHTRLQTPRDLETPVQPVVAATELPKTDKNASQAIDPLLAAAAHANGTDLVSVGDNGARQDSTARQEGARQQLPITQSNQTAARTAQRTYKAAPGDTVSKLAARFLGGNTRVNRDLIIAANPSLRDNPNKIVVGQNYEIPAAVQSSTGAVSASEGQGPAAQPAASQPPAVIATARWSYTVKSNDTLWGIANTQLGDPSSVDAIKELNRDVLKGGNTVRPGMKLMLPAKPLASAN